MSIFTRIAGVFGALFQIGGPNSPGVRSNTGGIEARNSANSAFAVVRGADPAINDDLVTLRYFNAHAGSGAVVSTAYATGEGGPLDPAGGNVTLATLVVNIVAGQNLDLEFDAWVNGSGDPGAQIQFLCEIDGTPIQDNGTVATNILNETTQWVANTVAETQPFGGSYNRIARVTGLGTGAHTVAFIGNASSSPIEPNVNNIAIRAYITSL